MNLTRFSFWTLILLCLVSTGCEEATLVGSDLLDDDQLELGFTDDVTLTAQTIPTDLLDTKNNLTYMIGQLDDPFFGMTTADLYVTVIRDLTLPDLTGVTVDSFVLIMEYDTAGIYGDTNAMHNLKVFRLRETLLDRDTILFNQSFMADMDPVGEATLAVNPMEPIILTDPKTGESDTIAAQIRIPLDIDYAQEIIAALPTIETDTAFVEIFNGLKITSTPDRSSFIGVNPQGSDGVSKLTMYYHTDEDTLSVNFRIVSNTSAFIENDIAGYPVEAFLNDPVKGDSLLFMQGMAGPNIEIDLADVRNLDDIFINHAELELTIAELPGDDPDLYRPVVNTLISERDEDGELTLISDVQVVLTSSSFPVLYGGDVETVEVNGEMVKKVRMNITRHVKEILDDPELSSKIVLSPLIEIERPQRTIYYGPGHSTYPAKLNITFTAK